MRLRPKHFILTTASAGLGLGLGVEGLMKREVAGPVPFFTSTARIVSVIVAVLAYRELW